MPAFVNLIGHIFGRLTVIDKGETRKRNTTFICLCECGSRITVFASNLKRGFTQSCGCLQQESRQETNRTHGMSGTPEFKIWVGIITRCENPNAQSFPHYGGRGIRICRGWREDFTSFYAQLGDRPSKHTVDRIKNNLHYSCGKCEECVENGWLMNCKWATRRTQAQNTRRQHLITASGETLCMSEWARRLNTSPRTILDRIQYGWDDVDAVTIPIGEKRHTIKPL